MFPVQLGIQPCPSLNHILPAIFQSQQAIHESPQSSNNSNNKNNNSNNNNNQQPGHAVASGLWAAGMISFSLSSSSSSASASSSSSSASSSSASSSSSSSSASSSSGSFVQVPFFFRFVLLTQRRCANVQERYLNVA